MKFKNIPGYLDVSRVEIMGAYPENILNQMASRDISFWDLKIKDEFTYIICIYHRDLDAVSAITAKGNYQFEIQQTRGILPVVSIMIKRGVFFCILLLLTGSVLFLQNKIWFINISGDCSLSSREILYHLETCGVSIGTNAGSIDIYELKNKLLSQMPEIEFVTVNVEGCMAHVILRQREPSQSLNTSYAPSNIMAKKDGVITSVTAISGTPVIKTGDIVTKDQLLISGVTNLDRILLLTEAEGEIFAKTYYNISGIFPKTITEKCYTGHARKYFSLSIGKNQINFFKTSGISYDNYDKMTDSYYLTLPMGLQLPIAIHITTCREYNPVTASTEEGEDVLVQSIRRQIQNSTVAGTILREQFSCTQSPDAVYCEGRLEVLEEIGYRVKIQN